MSDGQITICRTTLKILQYSFIWPSRHNEMNPGKWFYFRVFLFLLITLPWLLSIIMHLIVTVKYEIDVPITEDVAHVVALLGIYYTCLMFVKKQKKIAFLLKDMSNFKEYDKPSNLKAVNFRLWAIICNLYIIGGIVFVYALKFAQKSSCEQVNIEKNLNEVCGLISNFWAPFDVSYFLIYQFIFLYLFYSSQLIVKCVLMIFFLSMEMSHHLVVRIKHMQKILMKSLAEEIGYEDKKMKLRNCIMYHIEILEFAKRLDECFTYCMFGHLTMTGIICACIEKQILDKDNTLIAALHFTGWITTLSVACFGGQNLTNASVSLPNEMWSSVWYNVDTRLIKDISFMIFASQKELTLSAGSFGVISYPLLVSVLKMSYSVLCFLSK